MNFSAPYKLVRSMQALRLYARHSAQGHARPSSPRISHINFGLDLGTARSRPSWLVLVWDQVWIRKSAQLRKASKKSYPKYLTSETAFGDGNGELGHELSAANAMMVLTMLTVVFILNFARLGR